MAENSKTMSEAKAKLARIVSENINSLCPTRVSPKKTIAEICGVSQTMVTKWTSNEPVLPPASALLIIAQYFAVDLAWLLEDHTANELPDRTKTYTNAFVVLISCFDKHIIEKPEYISDPILKLLIGKYVSLKNSDKITPSELYSWLDKIIKAFYIPIPIEHHNNRAIIDDILKYENTAAVDEDIKLRNLALALNDTEIVERSKERLSSATKSQMRQRPLALALEFESENYPKR